jgi:hypothetical protein
MLLDAPVNMLADAGGSDYRRRLAKGLGNAAFGHGRLHPVPVHVSDAVDHFDEHLSEPVLPHIPEDALCCQGKVGLRRRLEATKHFGKRGSVHGHGYTV